MFIGHKIHKNSPTALQLGSIGEIMINKTT